MVTSTHIRIPVDVKKHLEERAGSRSIGAMLREDFLHEPDILKIVETKLNAITEKLESRLETISNMFVLLETGQTQQFFAIRLLADKLGIDGEKILQEAARLTIEDTAKMKKASDEAGPNATAGEILDRYDELGGDSLDVRP